MTPTPHGTDVVQKRRVFLCPQPVCSAGLGRYVAWLGGSIIGTFADLKIETWSAPQPISGIFAQAVPYKVNLARGTVRGNGRRWAFAGAESRVSSHWSITSATRHSAISCIELNRC